MRKLLKTSIWAIFWQIWGQISPNWKSFWKIGFIQIECYIYIVLTSGQKPKNSLELFLKKYQVSDFGLIWRPFCKYLQIKNFFQISGPVVLPTNQPTNQPANHYKQHQSYRTWLTPVQSNFWKNQKKIRKDHFTQVHQKSWSYGDIIILHICTKK